MPTLGKTKVSPSLISTGSLFLGTSSYAVTASFALNSSGGGGGGSVQTGSIAKQTILYNVVSGSSNTITGLNLSGNKWGVDIKEEWDAVIIAGDQYYNSCSLLLHCDGSNGSTTFTDNSPSPKTVTAYNGAAISTAQSKFGGASALFDGTNDYIATQSSTAFEFGSGNFTIEGWIYPTANVTNTYYAWISKTVGSGYGEFYFPQRNGNLYIFFSYNGSSWGIHGVNSGYIFGALTINAWNNFAITRQGDTIRSYLNGVAGSTFSLPTGQSLYATSGYGVGIGANNDGSERVTGYADEIRITKGVARYTTNFTTSSVAFPNNASVTQYATKYVGLIGGLNDSNVDYGVQKMSDSSLKVVKMTQTTSPLVGSGSLSGSVDRVYVNVLDYTKVSVTSSYARNSLSASYLIPTSNNTTKAIFGYGYNGSINLSIVNLVNNTGIVASDTTGVGTARRELAAAGYGVDKAIFGYGNTGAVVSMTNLVSNTGVVATDTTGVGTARRYLAAAGYGTDKAIFGYGFTSIGVSMTNLVSSVGVVATDTTGVGTDKYVLSATGYGFDKAIFGYGYNGSANISITNLVSNTGVVATDTTGVGTARRDVGAARYGNDKAIFGYGLTSVNVSMTNLVSNTGVVATDTTGVGTIRTQVAAAGYGVDKAIFGYGYTTVEVSMVNLVSNVGVVANDTTGVGTSRRLLVAAGYSTS